MRCTFPWRCSWVPVAAVAFGWPVGSAVQAQDDEAVRSEVEEIIVTAQKREERLQDTPLSVSAITGSTLDEKGVSTGVDIREFVPNLNIHPNAGGNSGMTINVRGAITSDPLVSLETATGIYVDGVYVAKSAGSQFDLADLERIEVLRGPQGTLYGRNTIGGAINLVTRKPTDELSVRTTFNAGNFDYFKNVTTLNVPIIGENGIDMSDTLGTLSGRATFAYRNRDGFFENSGRRFDTMGTGAGSTEFDNLGRFATRGALRWQLDALTVDYAFEYHSIREDSNAFQLTAVRPGSPAGFVFPDFASFQRTNREDSTPNNSVITPFGTVQDLENDLTVRGHSITTALDLGEVGPFGNLTLKSITGFRSLDELEVQDLDGTPLHVADMYLGVHHEQISQEIQLVGATPDAEIGRFDYVLGFFYYDEDGSENNPQVFFGGGSSFISKNDFSNQSYAPFGQTTYTPPILDDRLSVTAGLRYTHEDKTHNRDYDCVVVPDPSTGAPMDCDLIGLDFKDSADKSFDNLSPMGNIAYKATDDLMAYGRIARGFKSGGFNGRATSLDTFRNPFDEETLTAYELGFKSQWLDNRLRFNAAGFFNDYKDLQVAVFKADPLVGTRSTLTNAADAEVWGAEIEALAVPLPGVDVRFAYGLLRPQYNKFIDCVKDPNNPGGPCVNRDVSSERDFVISPEHTLSGGLAYTAPPMEKGTFSISLDAYYQTEVFFLVKDSELMKQGDYVLFNTRAQLVGIPTEYGSLDLAVWSRNLFDKKYKSFGIDFGRPEDGGLGYSINSYGNPRTFGVELTWRWEQEA